MRYGLLSFIMVSCPKMARLFAFIVVIYPRWVFMEHEEVLYSAFKARDRRFDGRFFVGVSSTGIYCRPICWTRMPRLTNCTFFTSAAEAEKEGYRPCLLCRPELAPGNAPLYAKQTLARKAARLLEEHCGHGESLDRLAERLGCTDRHLRRVFMEEYQVTPVQYLQTCRLLLAKNLLTDTEMSILQVAMAAGFGSQRRMNDLFQKRYRLSPTSLRKHASEGKCGKGLIKVELGYRPPYCWGDILEFLANRAVESIEKIENGTYCRTVHLRDRAGKSCVGWMTVARHPKRASLVVSMNDALIPVLSQVLSRTRHLFDLHCDPDAVHEVLQSMNELQPGIYVKGRRIPGCFDHFEMAVRAILYQQTTIKEANTLAGRLAKYMGMPVETGIAGLSHAFPTAKNMVALGSTIRECLGSIGIAANYSQCLLDFAQALERGEILIGHEADPLEEIKRLQNIRNISGWTARYIAMRVMGWPDVFLEDDAEIHHALSDYTPMDILKLSERWRPWRSYAVINLWQWSRRHTAHNDITSR